MWHELKYLTKRFSDWFDVEDRISIEVILVSNTFYPFLIHNVSILSIPAGITYRFRYEINYFENSNVNDLQGKLGLFVLRDHLRATFIPLRTFRFFRVDNFGTHVFLELEFLDYVKYDLEHTNKQNTSKQPGETDEERFQRLDRERSERLLATREIYSPTISELIVEKKIDNVPDRGIKKLILTVEPCKVCKIKIDQRLYIHETLKYWSNIVKLLGSMDCYAKISFYQISTITDIGSDQPAKLFKGVKRKGFKLYAGRTYQMQIFQLMSTFDSPPPPGYTIKIENISDHVLPLRNSEIVDGAYDRLEFLFYVLPQEMRRVNSFLEVVSSQTVTDPKKTISVGTVLGELDRLIKESDGQSVATQVADLQSRLKEEEKRENSSIPPSRMQLEIKWTKWAFVRKRILPLPVGVIAVVLYYLSKELGVWLAGTFGLGSPVRPEFIQLFAFILLAWSAGNWTTFTGAFKAQSVAGPKS